jgi:ankyrin repeat protein
MQVEQSVRQQRKHVGSSVPLTDTEVADMAFLELCDRGDRDGAIALLKNGQQINVADARGETAVHKATRRGQNEFVAELLKYGCVADYADIDGVTPIMIAVQFGNAELVELFISKKVNLKAVTKDGATLLHTAAYSGHEDTLSSLIQVEQVGALLEMKDNNGRTPLQIASFRASKDVCAMLVGAGANYAVRDNRGNDCATLASRTGRRKSRDFFERLSTGSAAGPDTADHHPPIHKKK